MKTTSQGRSGSDWELWRQDDNGGRVRIRSGLTETDAERLVREFEERGHKQAYWAKRSKSEG